MGRGDKSKCLVESTLFDIYIPKETTIFHSFGGGMHCTYQKYVGFFMIWMLVPLVTNAPKKIFNTLHYCHSNEATYGCIMFSIFEVNNKIHS